MLNTPGEQLLDEKIEGVVKILQNRIKNLEKKLSDLEKRYEGHCHQGRIK